MSTLNTTEDGEAPVFQKLFADIPEHDVQQAIADQQRDDYHRRNPSAVSPPSPAWRRVMVLANPRMIFDFQGHKIYVHPDDWPLLETLFNTYLFGRESAEELL